METEERKPVETAIYRKCNGCGMSTAIDMDDTPQHRKEMKLDGQIVMVEDSERVRLLWANAGPCRCKKG